jgi:hypothetical protein
MSDKAWDAIVTMLLIVTIAAVIYGIAFMFYKSGVNTHTETMAKIEACSAEYVLDREAYIHYLTMEYCGGTITDRVKKVDVPSNPSTQGTQR